ncbi:MAG: acyltransferase family protein [Lachnospiraceae bacterium]|nr:acyltransferase family protein [Lachnospiraceae bacterium]
MNNNKINEYFCPNYIRVLQFFGIVFVVCGHFGCNIFTIDGWFPYYSFHMPLFVFISGYLYNDFHENNIVKYLFNRVKRLIFPFYVTSFAYLVLQTILVNRWGEGIGLKLSLYNWLVFPWVRAQPIGFTVAGWFVFTLFIVQVFNIIIRKILKRIGRYKKK